MNHQRKTIFIVGAATAAISAAVIALPAMATDPLGGFAPTQLSFGTFGALDIKAEKDDKWDLSLKSKGLTDVRVTRVAFPAGSSSGWHSHPGPNLLTVTQGSVVVYESSNPLCVPGTTYTAQTVTVPTGGTFSDNGGSHVHLVRNETGAPAEIMAVAFYPHGVTPRTTSKPRPTNCPENLL